MQDSGRPRDRGFVRRAADAALMSAASRRQVAQLARRVTDLEAEVQENRRLNRRLAELTDVVQELLVPVELRDEDRLREALDRYTDAL
jgi:cell shape-determining protein MreC